MDQYQCQTYYVLEQTDISLVRYLEY
jgi:hypothetical protein